MITILADHNIVGQADLLWSAVTAGGWLDLVPLRLRHFKEIGLAVTSSDCDIWRFVQAQRMLLLTGNRNRKRHDSLEETIQRENQPTCFPVITISRSDRIVESGYRRECAARLAEIALYLDNYLGTGRLYIP